MNDTQKLILAYGELVKELEKLYGITDDDLHKRAKLRKQIAKLKSKIVRDENN